MNECDRISQSNVVIVQPSMRRSGDPTVVVETRMNECNLGFSSSYARRTQCIYKGSSIFSQKVRCQ